MPREVKMLFTGNDKFYKNRYNYATFNEVAEIFVGHNGEPPIEKDICIYCKAEEPIRIHNISKHVDPMTYPLLYPHGGFGWMPNMKSNIKHCNISALQFYSYKLLIREINPTVRR